MTLQELRNAVSPFRGRRRLLRSELEEAARQFAAAPEDERSEIARRMEDLRTEVAALRTQELARLDFEHPGVFLPELDNQMPILLMPLRLQTRWEGGDDPALLIRVYPDDIFVQSHDPALTKPELDAGRAYHAANGRKREIWRGMAAEFGLRRAAYAREATAPGAAEPVVTKEHIKVPAAWTLPERLVFRLTLGGGQVFERVGPPIPDGLEMSFDLTRPDLGFRRGPEDLEFAPEMAWQVNFDEAVKVGMATRIPLEDLRGERSVQRLVVLGVRLTADDRRSAALFERLIQEHGYTDGFSFLRQGTPTNITNDGDRSAAPDADAVLDRLESDGAFASPPPDQTEFTAESDGLRFARALGISPASLRHVEGADNTDAVDAIAMKRALWAGTLGYYAQQMLSPYFEGMLGNDPFYGERMIAAARFFFTNFVFGAGPLPAIRVGDQPYGVLPVSPTSLIRPGRNVQYLSSDFLTNFANVLQEKIAILAPTWVQLAGNVKRAGAGVNADDRLLSVLAQQASSVEYRSVRLIGREFLTAYTAFKNRQQHDEQIGEFNDALERRFTDFQAAFPGLFPVKPRVFDLSFFGGVWTATLEGLKKFERSGGMLMTGHVIDNLPLSETRGIGPDYPNYIKALARSTVDEALGGLTWTTPQGRTEQVSALLYLLLRHSLLYEHAVASMRLHRHFRNVEWPAFREKELYNLFFQFDETYWSYLREKVEWNLLAAGQRHASALDLIVDRESLQPFGPLWPTFFGDVEQQRQGLERLAKLKTGKLERLFAEHIDLASYRLDAWVTGLAYLRLITSRSHGDSLADEAGPRAVRFEFTKPVRYAADGLYLGAYGWLENLHPDAPGVPAPDVPQELRPQRGRAVTRDPDNYGLVHAPSLDHAVTAAVLRSGSVTQPNKASFNIDLSSARVRNALWLIEGVRRGQLPAALLGYRFERILADTAPQLLQHLPKLREVFPMPKPEETQTGEALESTPPLDVVNGMLIVQALRSDFAAKVAFAPAALPQFTRAAQHLADVLDAAGDLMLAESVHQAARGNYERAGGVVTAAGEFTHVPAEFQVVEPPRSGSSLTHRVLFCINSDAGGVAPPSPRSRLEPELNAWVGSLLPPIATLAVRVAYFASNADQAPVGEYTVRLGDLGLEPIDLLYAVDSEDSPELAARADAAARPQFDAEHPDTAPDKIRVNFFFQAAAGTLALGELLPLMDALRRLLTLARGGVLGDLVAPNQLHDLDETAKDGFDRADLIRRVFGVDAATPGFEDPDSLWFSFLAARDDLANDPDNAGLDECKRRLLVASLYGMPEAVPSLPVASANALAALRQQVKRVVGVMDARVKEVQGKWTAPTLPTGDILTLANEVTRILLGANFPLMPHIQPSAVIPADLAADAGRVEGWLFGAAQVREAARRLQDVRVLAAEFTDELPALGVCQAPEGLDWIADRLPPEKARDLASMVIQPSAADFDPALPFGALVIDEWHELVPQTTETTGIAFHYDAPNAEPPQSLLLAVSDRKLEENGWTWSDLVACVENALLLAKIRAVTPDQVRETLLDTVLPATYSAESSTPATIALSYMANVSAKVASSLIEAYSERG